MIDNDIKNSLLSKEKKLSEAFSVALGSAFKSMNYDLDCIDWLSYNPDFFIDQAKIKAA